MEAFLPLAVRDPAEAGPEHSGLARKAGFGA